MPNRGICFILVSIWIAWTATPRALAATPAAQGEPEQIALNKYKPIYFLMGTSYAKIQFSLDAQIVRDLPLHVAYTQLMLWDVFVPSPYFYDVNYNPIVFYRLALRPGTPESKEWIDLIPYEHESNGKGGGLERSWNRVGAAFNNRSSLGSGVQLYWNIKAWIPISYNENNLDLAQYRGVWEVTLTLSQFLGDHSEFNDLIFRLYPGGSSYTNPLKGGQELTLRVKALHGKFLPLAVFQIFHGVGEYLQDYSLDHWAVRAGIGF